MKNLRFILSYLKRHRLRYGAGIVTLFVVDFANLYIPKVTGTITDGLAGHSFTMPTVLRHLLILGFLGATLALGRFLWRYFLFGTARSIEREMRNDLFRHLEQMSVEYYNDHKTGDLMTRFTSDLNAIRMTIGMAVIAMFDAVVMTIMVIFQMMVYIDTKLTLLVLIPMAVIALGEIYYGKIMKPKYTARQEAVSDMMDYVQESFSGVRVVKAFVREHAQVLGFLRTNEATMNKSLGVVKLQAIVMPLLDVIIGCGTLITLIYGGYLALIGEITLGRFVAFNQYIGMLVWPMLACGEAMNLFSQGSASAARIREVLETPPEIPSAMPTGNAPASLSGNITLSHLTFTHKGRYNPTLEDLTLEIPRGTTLAVIGKTGAGKSTLVNLLLHLYPLPEGALLFDGVDINDIPLQVLRQSIAYVPQDNFLFSDTIAGNIAFGS